MADEQAVKVSAFEKAEYAEIEAAMARAAGYELELVDEAVPELGWKRTEPEPPKPIRQTELAPNVRHINRNKRTCWLGPGIIKPPHLRPPEAI